MKSRDAIRKAQLIALIKHACKQLDYKPPSHKVMERMEIGYLAYVLDWLKRGGLPPSDQALRSRWITYAM